MTTYNFPNYMQQPAVGAINTRFGKRHNGGYCYEVFGTDTTIFVASFNPIASAKGGFHCVLVDANGCALANEWFEVSGMNAAAVLFLFCDAVQSALQPAVTEVTAEVTESQPVVGMATDMTTDAPVIDEPGATDTPAVNEWGIVPSDFYNENGIFCNRKYADREAAKYNPRVWYLRYPNLPKAEMATLIADGIEQARQFVSEAKSEHNFQSVAQWYIQDGISKLQYEVYQRTKRQVARQSG